MNVSERVFEGCRIYAAAIPVPGLQGFNAAVVVKNTQAGADLGREVFRDERLLDGRVWMDASGALNFALEAGQAAVLAQMLMALGAQAGSRVGTSSSGF